MHQIGLVGRVDHGMVQGGLKFLRLPPRHKGRIVVVNVSVIIIVVVMAVGFLVVGQERRWESGGCLC